MWKNPKDNENNRADFLGTGQWGMESGGAPWGQTPASDASPSEQLTDSSNAITSGGSYKDVGRTMAEYVLGTAGDPTRGGPIHSLTISEANILSATTSASEAKPVSLKPAGSISSNSSGDAPNSTPSSTNNSPTNSQPDSSPAEHTPDNSQSEPAESSSGQKEVSENKTEDTPGDKPTENKSPQTTGADAKPGEAGGGDVSDIAEAKEGGADMGGAGGGIDGTIQQMQQLNLDSYANAMSMQQQMALAMQQQYMLAAQQQQLAMPGVFLSNLNPYIIAGPPTNPTATAGYTDPHTAAAAAQYSMMAQYAPYTWPTYTPLPTMPPPNVAPSTPSVTTSTPTSQSQTSAATARNSTQSSRSPFQSEGASTPSNTPQLQNQSDPASNTPLQQPQFGFNPMAMGAGYQMIPTAYYDQTGAFIVNNGRGGPLGGPVRLFAPAPFVMNGANVPSSGAVYTSPNITGGSSTPGAGQGPLYNPNIPPFGFNGSQGLGGTSFTSQASGMGGSASSTPQRRGSFSDPYSKHPGTYPSHMSNFYNHLSGSMGIGAISPSPGPFGVLGGQPPSHHSMSPPPSLSSPTNSLIGASHRQFPVAPGAEARYKNGNMMNAGIYGSSGSALFPPTRLRPISASGRSRLLDDFRNNRYPNPQLRDLVNHIVEFSRDQHGSRFIQQKLERAAPPEKQLVFNEISGAAYQLMTDVFGNYVIQKFFEFGSQEQKLALAQCIRGHVLALALQMYGCRVIQKALECIPQDEQVNIVKELDGHLLDCVKDQNGNHVVQKCIECVPPVHLQFIVESFKGNVVTLSRHPYGCRVMQRILEHCTVEQTTPILEELNQHIETLVMDQYGNYVIQHILEHGRPENKRNIVLELRGKVLVLSQHKFASNVVEKCVSNSPPQERILLIEEVCQDDESLYFMMKDQFANYVVQKMLDVAEPVQRNMLIAKIRPHMQHLRKYTYGKHIINKLEKFMMKPTSVPTSPSIPNPSSPTQQPPMTLEEPQPTQNVMPN